MTQALTDISNSLSSILTQQATSKPADTSYMSKPDNFASVIEAAQEKLEKTPLTLGDLKSLKTEQADMIADFRAILAQETKTANAESSLDMTLADDIENFIAQLKSQNTDTSEEDTAVVSDTEENSAEDLTDINISALSTTTEPEMTDESVLKGFVNTDVMEKLSELENMALQNVQLISSEDITFQTDVLTDILNNNNTDISTYTGKLTETISEFVTDNTTKSAQEPTIQEPEISDEMLRELNVELVEAETDAAFQQSYDMQQQTPEEHVLKAMLGVDVKGDFEAGMTDSIETTEVGLQESKETTTEKIIEQFSKHINGIKANSKVDIVLNPERLGKVSVHVTKTAEGMSAQLTVTTSEARDILMKNLDGLKETLLSHGVTVDNVSVKMNETQKSEYKQDWTEQDNSEHKNREQHHQQKEEKDKSFFEKMMAFMNQDETESI